MLTAAVFIIRSMFVAGERGDPKTFDFFADLLEVPLIDHWYRCVWQASTKCGSNNVVTIV